MRIVLLGKPGSGKGTQSQRIAAKWKVPAISTGDLIRAAIATNSPLGQEFKRYTSAGQLVPDELVLAMVGQRFESPDCRDGFLLDGFPRTIAQAEGLEALLQGLGTPLDGAVYIAVPDSALLERAVGRRFCAVDGRSYHMTLAPPHVPGTCDQCGGLLQQRDDDREDVVKVRLAEYEAKSFPLLQFYGARSMRSDVSGMGSMDEIQSRIEEAIRILENRPKS